MRRKQRLLAITTAILTCFACHMIALSTAEGAEVVQPDKLPEVKSHWVYLRDFSDLKRGDYIVYFPSGGKDDEGDMWETGVVIELQGNAVYVMEVEGQGIMVGKKIDVSLVISAARKTFDSGKAL